ncbi:unnamed protein product [Rotaria sp. Silwood1]|nr:unnamed protein product [Rotaria sp. Silwood1]
MQNNTPALLGRVCIEFNKNDYRQTLNSYKRASKYASGNSDDIRVGLANAFLQLYKLENTELAFNRTIENYTHVRQLAMHALNYTENEAIQAESCYHLAQDYHAEWNYEEAFCYYYQTTHLALKKFVLPLFDLE